MTDPRGDPSTVAGLDQTRIEGTGGGGGGEEVSIKTITETDTLTGEGICFIGTLSSSPSLNIDGTAYDPGDTIVIADAGGNLENNSVYIYPNDDDTIAGGSSEMISGAGEFLEIIYGNDNDWKIVGQPESLININDGMTTITEGMKNLSFSPNITLVQMGPSEIGMIYDHPGVCQGSFNGEVADGDYEVVLRTSVPDASNMDIFTASLTQEVDQAVPTGVDLKIVSFDGSGTKTDQQNIASGDGDTVFTAMSDYSNGGPIDIASAGNSSGSEQVFAVVVENTSGGAVTVRASAEGVVARDRDMPSGGDGGGGGDPIAS